MVKYLPEVVKPVCASSISGAFDPREPLSMSGDNIGGGGGGQWYWHLWAEAWDTSKHLAVPRTAPTRNHPSPSINGVEVEKSYSGTMQLPSKQGDSDGVFCT